MAAHLQATQKPIPPSKLAKELQIINRGHLICSIINDVFGLKQKVTFVEQIKQIKTSD
jgi:hypothetical protein